MKHHRECQFDHRPAAVAQARHFVTEAMTAWGLADANAELAVSELATNAVRHAGNTFTVRITEYDNYVRVEVSNGSVLLPAVRQPTLDRDGGRGLFLVQAVTTGWGVVPSSHGKAVWFTVAARPELEPDRGASHRTLGAD
jgi:anti-sigma regulatory factor (Ser/Thr protein kinase)